MTSRGERTPGLLVARAEFALVVVTKRPELPCSADHHHVTAAGSDIHHCVGQRRQLPRLENILADTAVPRILTISPAEERAAVGDDVRRRTASSDPLSNESIERRDPLRGVLQQQQGTEGRGTLAQNSCKGNASANSMDLGTAIAVT